MVNTKEENVILMVDDDEIQLEIATLHLKYRYKVVTAKSGKEALDLLIHGLTPNLILLDIMMPSMDGWETFNRLKAISYLQNVPIVFLSSATEKSVIDRAFEMGAADFIGKPLTKKNLCDRINKVLNKND